MILPAWSAIAGVFRALTISLSSLDMVADPYVPPIRRWMFARHRP
jgi:hypothetical protein